MEKEKFIMVTAFNQNDEISIKKVKDENHFDMELKFLKYYNWAKLIQIDDGNLIKQVWSGQKYNNKIEEENILFRVKFSDEKNA